MCPASPLDGMEALCVRPCPRVLGAGARHALGTQLRPHPEQGQRSAQALPGWPCLPGASLTPYILTTAPIATQKLLSLASKSKLMLRLLSTSNTNHSWPQPVPAGALLRSQWEGHLDPSAHRTHSEEITGHGKKSMKEKIRVKLCFPKFEKSGNDERLCHNVDYKTRTAAPGAGPRRTVPAALDGQGLWGP